MSTTIVEKVGSNSESVTFASLSQPFENNIIHFDTLPHNAEVNTDYGISFFDESNRIIRGVYLCQLDVDERQKFSTRLAPFEESVLMSSNTLLGVRKPCSEVFSVEDILASKTKFKRSVSESVALGEAYANKLVNNKSERFTLKDSTIHFDDVVFAFGNVAKDFEWNSISFNIRKRPQEAINFNELYARRTKTYRSFSASLGITEQDNRLIANNNDDSFLVGEGRGIFGDLTESFAYYDYRGFEDIIIFNIKKQPTEKIIVGEKLGNNVSYHLYDMFSASDAISNKAVFKRSFAVEFSATDFECNSIKYNEADNFTIADDNNFRAIARRYDNFTIGDNFRRNVLYRRLLQENYAVTDLLKNSSNKKLCDNFNAYDCMIHASKGVLSNLYIKEGAMSDYDFANYVNTVNGYTRFAEFKVGEYEYNDALVRITMTASDQVKPTAQEVVLHVDIPDTDDRGTAVITNTSGATQIPFNKSYYTAPEVQVTLRSATSSQGMVIPSIVNITNQYFEVQLMNSSNQLVQGSISWVAKGY